MKVEEKIFDTEKTIKLVEGVIVNVELPKGLAGECISQSNHHFHEVLTLRMAALRELQTV